VAQRGEVQHTSDHRVVARDTPPLDAEQFLSPTNDVQVRVDRDTLATIETR
jgi:hypothetical protein